ncbi:MAG TPA: hypothetical protein VIW29_21115, partial [Polyangiaceae bacterium]
AARRLTIPAALERAWSELGAPNVPPTPSASPSAAPRTALGALKRVRSKQPPERDEEPPPSVPRFSRPPPLPVALAEPIRARVGTSSTGPVPAARTPPAHSGAELPPTRAPTAAEILLARRRGRKS